jgi:hypothetical protein
LKGREIAPDFARSLKKQLNLSPTPGPDSREWGGHFVLKKSVPDPLQARCIGSESWLQGSSFPASNLRNVVEKLAGFIEDNGLIHTTTGIEEITNLFAAPAKVPCQPFRPKAPVLMDDSNAGKVQQRGTFKRRCERVKGEVVFHSH